MAVLHCALFTFEFLHNILLEEKYPVKEKASGKLLLCPLATGVKPQGFKKKVGL